MKDENKNSVIKLNDLPEDIQERIREQYKLTEDKNAIIHSYTNVTIDNHNTYNINIFDNKGGIINERDEPLLDQLMRAMGMAAGKTWALILRHLTEKSYNANQLAKALNMDYKTIRHHLKVLVKKRIITRGQDEYSGLYFIAKNIESDLDGMDL